MKKLFKQEWKYYLFFLLVLTGMLFVTNNYWLEMIEVEGEGALLNLSKWSGYCVYWDILYGIACFVEGELLSLALQEVLAVLLIVKSIFFWMEKERSGREFIGTLPVKRIDRMAFHFIMDGLLVVIPITVYAVCRYYQINSLLLQRNIEIPWLAGSIFGGTLTSIAYLLFLLGLINVLESLFASGFVRIIGTVGGIYAGFGIIDFMFTLNEGVKWVQNLYGYLALESAGGSFYLPVPAGKSLYDEGNFGWGHKAMDYTMYYKGELVETSDEIKEISMFGIDRVVDFSNMDSYIGYVLSYLILAALLIVVAVYLVKRQEASKSEFYFKAGRYLLCAVLSGYLTMIILLNAIAVWHKCLIVAAGIMVFIGLNYCMDTDRKKYFKSGKIV